MTILISLETGKPPTARVGRYFILNESPHGKKICDIRTVALQGHSEVGQPAVFDSHSLG